MDIDQHAPATTRQQRHLSAPPDVVFALLVSVNDWPRWQSGVTTARIVDADALTVGGTFRWKSRGASIVSTVHDLDAPRTVVWTGRAIGTSAVHVWHLEPAEGGTWVRTEESMSGWLPRLLPRMVQRALDQGVGATLDALEEEVSRA